MTVGVGGLGLLLAVYILRRRAALPLALGGLGRRDVPDHRRRRPLGDPALHDDPVAAAHRSASRSRSAAGRWSHERTPRRVAIGIAVVSVLLLGWRAPYYVARLRQARRPGDVHRGTAQGAEGDPRRAARRRGAAALPPDHGADARRDPGDPLRDRAAQGRARRRRSRSAGRRAAGVLLIGGRSTSSPAPAARSTPTPSVVGAQAVVEPARCPASSGSAAAAAGPPTRAAPDAASVSSWQPMPISLDTDAAHLARAIELAEGGRGRVSPNPLVGAVVVARRRGARRGLPRRLRRGARRARRARRLHGGPARRDALRLARAVLPPRADAAVHRRDPRGRDRRVVVASDDPTEKASGRGLGILRDEGVEVVVADGEPAMRARLLNQAFRKHARTGRPHVLFKSAMTLDGKVATRTGDSKWISGEESRTALAPLARRARRGRRRDRHRAGRRPAAHRARSTASLRQPRRVVFDSEGRLPLDSQLVRGAPELPLTVVVGRAASRLADRRARGRRAPT